MATEFKLPELGENVTSANVLSVKVAPGDMVQKDQIVLELETDKATVEVPSTISGRVKDVQVKPDEKVKVGQVIFTADADEAAAEAPKAKSASADAAAPADAKSAAKKSAAAEEDEQEPAKPAGGSRQKREASAAARPEAAPQAQEPEVEEEAEPDEPVEAPARRGEVVNIGRGPRPAAEPRPKDVEVAAAAPSVRRMARELGVEIGRVPGSGPGGRISPEDVKTYVRRSLSGGGRGGAHAEPLPDFSRWGHVERKTMRAVRRKTAEHLSAAWSTIPHVTQHGRADITALDKLRKQYEPRVEQAGGKLTVTSIAVRVIASALKQFPQFNSSVDMENEEIIYKQYVNIGVAVDTDRGLLVPVIRNADQKNIVELSVELNQLAEKARNKKTTLEDLEGGTFTISNLGGLGGDYFSPIINLPEVAILGVSRAKTEPVYVGSQLEPRLMLPLSLSYDHRVIDGADAIRFLRWVMEALEQPFLLSLQG